MFYCAVCKKDFRSRCTLYKHKRESKDHLKKMKELVLTYKDTIGTGNMDTIKSLGRYGLIVYKLTGRKTALHILEDFIPRETVGDRVIHHSCCYTCSSVVCFCDYCKGKKCYFDDDKSMCEDYENEAMKDSYLIVPRFQ
jgi:hypothetical protein